MANGMKSRRRISARKVLMATMAFTKAVTKPTANMGKSAMERKSRLFVEIQAAGRDHHGHRHDEGEFRCRVAADAHQHAAADGGAGAGETGPECQALEQADAEGLLVADVVQGLPRSRRGGTFRR